MNNRFVDDGGSAQITHLPQCVECEHNLGSLDCSALGKKPVKYLSNEENCPEYSATRKS